jgi:hypothetical protein
MPLIVTPIPAAKKATARLPCSPHCRFARGFTNGCLPPQDRRAEPRGQEQNGTLAVARNLWVPKTSSTSRDQAIFVDRATDASMSSDAVLLEIDRFG